MFLKENGVPGDTCDVFEGKLTILVRTRQSLSSDKYMWLRIVAFWS